MRSRWIIFEAGLVVAIVLVWYFAVFSRTYPQVAMLQWVGDADARVMFEEDVTSGKRRFFTFAGFNTYIVGIPDAAYRRCYASVPLELIDGTSDAALNEEHSRLLRRAEAFAGEYNFLMRTHIDAETPEKCVSG